VLSEEDKSSRVALEYWFRRCDLDSDGYISGYEVGGGGGDRKRARMRAQPAPFARALRVPPAAPSLPAHALAASRAPARLLLRLPA
jgi:hypothetical protein